MCMTEKKTFYTVILDSWVQQCVKFSILSFYTDSDFQLYENISHKLAKS